MKRFVSLREHRLFESFYMWIKLCFAALALAAGVAVAFQGATNQGLQKSVGIGPALIVNTVVVLLGVIGLWFATGAGTTFFPVDVSWTFYLGGVFGFVIITVAVLVFPRLGAAYAIALMVCGQCLAALLIDHYGLLNMEPSPITLQRLIGVALVVGGVAVFRL
jgi:bacterial/archaeal transporter family-2 protein